MTLRTHLGRPDDPRVSACGFAWWRLGRQRPRRVLADPTCSRCPRARAFFDDLRALRFELLRGRPILVLDFDGVLNHAAFYRARGTGNGRDEARTAGSVALALSAPDEADPRPGPTPPIRFTGVEMTPGPRRPVFDSACVARAGELAHDVGAAVVVSSSWRDGDSLFGLRALLVGYRFDPRVPWLAVTPDLPSRDTEVWSRPREIVSLLDELPEAPPAVVVLDDDPIDGPLAPFHVRTDPNGGGFTEEAAARARAILATPPAPIPWRLWSQKGPTS